MSATEAGLDIVPSSPAVRPVPASTEQSPRDLRKGALRDLVRLATESAATEAQIEQQYHAKLAQAKEAYEKAEWAVGQRYDSRRAAEVERHNQVLAQIKARVSAEAAALKEADEPARRKIENEFANIGQTVKKKIDQAAWMADSALEIATNQVLAQEQQIREEMGKEIAALDVIEAEARQRATRYGIAAGDPVQGVAPPVAADAALSVEQAAAAFETARAQVNAKLARLRSLFLPPLVVGSMPFLIGTALCVVAAGGALAATGIQHPNYALIGGAAGAAVVLTLVLFLLLRGVARGQVREAYGALSLALGQARGAAQGRLEVAAKIHGDLQARAQHKRDSEVRAARAHYAPASTNAQKKRDTAIAALNAQSNQEKARIIAQRDKDLADENDRHTRVTQELAQKQDRDLQLTRQQFERQTHDAQTQHDEARAALEARLREGLVSSQAPAESGDNRQGTPDWESPAWTDWKPPKGFAAEVRFGELEVDLQQIAATVPQTLPPRRTAESEDANGDSFGRDSFDGHATDGESTDTEEGDGQAATAPAAPVGDMHLALPPAFAMPATLAFPRQASLLIEADREGRPMAIRALQTAMTRLLTTLPAGRVRFTLIDPVGLGQNFAGFMHLADHDEALVGGRIWTEAEQIDQRLNNLTAHMETVIQKYLRNEYDTIDQYNAEAGELAEPYRFLVISDFPAGFSDESLRRLSSIASTGARCGVYTLIYYDKRQDLPHGTHLEDLEQHSVTLAQENDHFVWKDDVFGMFPLKLDWPPDEERLTLILDKVGKGAKEAKRVEVSFDTIAPHSPEIWTGDSTKDIGVPIGKMGATRLQYMRLGRGVAQHVLIAGKTGSGKSTLLHALVTNLAMWYSPQQVEFYLIDFKKGVEFKTYATHRLPHARAIAVESDREFGLSVLQRLDAELARRGDLFRRAGAQDLAGYRATPNPQVVPRTLLIVDEFQEFFSEDDKVAQEASVLMDRLVRQGRAFGMHVLLGSQTIGGAGLARSTLTQMAVRVALQTSDADSQIILGDNNSAAKLLTRPGEAIYNDQGGLVEANSPFQIAWLPDERREVYLKMLRGRADALGNGYAHREAVVFEGNAPADILLNQQLGAMLSLPTWPEESPAPRAFVGDPVAIKDPTAIAFRHQSGSNLLLIGQHDEAAMAIMSMAIVSLAAQHAPGKAKFYVLDATPPDSPLAGVFARVKDAVPHEVNLIEFRGIGDAIGEIAKELADRREHDQPGAAEIYFLVYGMQRYRMLRKAEDDFSFSPSSDEKPADPGKQFAEIFKEGPTSGIHVLAWADTPVAIERTLDRGSLREFDNRILFQMSANDSSNLIDSPAANKLGFHRALAYSEEQGMLEKFRPYAVPSTDWLAGVKEKLARKAPTGTPAAS